MANLIQSAGSQGNKQTRFAPIFINRHFTGLYTQRNPLRDPSDTIREKFYGGRPDALNAGTNVELSNRLTLVRRPGLSAFSAATYPEAPDYFYSFQKASGAIDVIVDTSAHIYTDNQDGTKTLILTKGAGAAQSQFQGVGSTLYIGNGADLQKWNDFGTTVPGNNRGNTTNPSWNWGVATPAAPPTVLITPSGSSAVVWQALTMFTTMGLLVDSNGNVQQLTSVNALGTNTTQFGTTGAGQPLWNNTPGTTTTDNTITWTNKGPIGIWMANTLYNNASGTGSVANPNIIYDPASNSCYLNAAPGNATGTTSGTRPVFTGAFASVFHDGSVKWFCLGSPKNIQAWQPGHSFPTGVSNNFSVSSISEPGQPPAPAGQTNFWMLSSGGTSASTATAPPWSQIAGQNTIDNQLNWICQGSATWPASHTVSAYQPGTLTFSVIKDANGNMQVCSIGGTTGTILPGRNFTLTAAANASGGNTSYTGTFSPTLTPGFPVTITGFTTGANNGTFQVVSCSATTLVVNNPAGVAETHAGVASFNPWETAYGANTNDGTAQWVCVGQSSAWAANTIWYLPVSGFAVPSPSQPYGGATIKDSNSNIQTVTQSGKSGSSAPSWGGFGTFTTDGTITWFCDGVFTANSFSWTKGHVYAYSYKARSTADIYNTTAPPGLMNPLGPPTGSASGGVSTASSVFTITGANIGAVNTVSGIGSTDPQVDTIVIWRDADGGGSANMFFLTEIPNPAPIGGMAQPWMFNDFIPDLPTSTLPGLNVLEAAPIDDANDPPPAAFVPDDFHFGRVWGHVGNVLYFSGGPDTLVGNGNETFPPANSFTFPGNITRSLSTPTGLLVFTTDNLYIVAGGPLTASFFNQPLLPGTGLLSFNALDVQGGTIFLFTSDRQFISIDPSAGESEVGFPIGDQLSTINPASAYVTVHIAGSADKGVYIADGSTGWFRLNPNQAPEGGAVWSPKATITGGCKAVKSIETTPGVHTLLAGATTGGQTISKRDLTVFSDNGTPYASNFTMGVLNLVQPSQLAEMGFIETDAVRVGTSPVVRFLNDELTGTFIQFTGPDVQDPPELYGAAGAPSTIFANRFYFNSTMSGTTLPPPAWCRFTSIQVDYGNTDTVQNELLTITIFGAHYQER